MSTVLLSIQVGRSTKVRSESIPKINRTRVVRRLVNDFRALNTITGRADIFISFVDLLCYSEFHAIKRSSGN